MKTQESDIDDRFLWCRRKKEQKWMFFLTRKPLFFFVVLFVFSSLYMKPAQSTTVGPVERVRGIKNKDINPVCLSLSLSREVRLRFARLPLRPLCLSWDTLCLFVEAGPSRAASAQCVCAAAPIYKYLPSRKSRLSCLSLYHFRLRVIKEHFNPNCLLVSACDLQLYSCTALL